MTVRNGVGRSVIGRLGSACGGIQQIRVVAGEYEQGFQPPLRQRGQPRHAVGPGVDGNRGHLHRSQGRQSQSQQQHGDHDLNEREAALLIPVRCHVQHASPSRLVRQSDIPELHHGDPFERSVTVIFRVLRITARRFGGERQAHGADASQLPRRHLRHARGLGIIAGQHVTES